MNGESRVFRTLSHLSTHGWITLRSMSALLGYSHSTGVYSRQRGKNPIPTVKVGGTYRVYADDVIKILENVREPDQEAARTFLRIYRALLNDGEQNE